MEATVACPYCGEEISLWIDPGGGAEQAYVQDCDVCCRPIEVRAVEEEANGFAVYVMRSDE